MELPRPRRRLTAPLDPERARRLMDAAEGRAGSDRRYTPTEAAAALDLARKLAAGLIPSS